MQIVKIISWVVLISALFPLLLITLWCISFGFPVGYIGFMLLASGSFLVFKHHRSTILASAYLLWVLCNFLLLDQTVRVYNEKSEQYFQTISRGEELGVRQKFNIYGLNILMATLAYPLYPEVSMETLLLVFPDDDGIRYFENGFFLNSRVVNKALAAATEKEWYLKWSVRDYRMGQSEARYALALNPCEMSRECSADECAYQVKVRIEYPPECEVVLLEKPVQIRVEEGLFWYLQKKNWLFPYEAVWTERLQKH